MIGKMRKMPSRLSLPAWLEQQVCSNCFKGLKWSDRSKLQFVVPWKHASRHGWLEEDDAALFKAWAVYTKRYNEKRGDEPRPKVWKANFRCAVNACPDIKPVKGLGSKRGKNAYRVFHFSKNRKSKRTVTERNPGRPMPDMGSIKIKKETRVKEEDEDVEDEASAQTPCVHSHNTRRQSNKRPHNESREEIKQEQEDNTYQQQQQHTQLKRPKIERADSYTSQCMQLPEMPTPPAHQLPQQPQQSKTTDKKSSNKTTEECIKDIKTENEYWHHMTIKEMIQSIPQLPRQGELGPICQNFYNSMQHDYSSSLNQNNYTYPYNFAYNPMRQMPPPYTPQSSTETNSDVLSFMYNYAQGLFAANANNTASENDTISYEDFSNSSSDEGSIMGCRRPGSVASSLTDEELETMLLDTDVDCYPNEFEKYEEMTSEEATSSMDTLNFISTCTDPFLSGERGESNMQAISEAMRTDFI